MDISDANLMLLTFGPYLIMIMLVLLSIFNSSLKGFVYLFGVVILFMIVKALSSLKGPPITVQSNNAASGNSAGSNSNSAASGNSAGSNSNFAGSNSNPVTSSILNRRSVANNVDPLTIMVDPFNAALYIFTITYLLLPMLEHGTFNVPLLIFLVCIYTHYMISMISMIPIESSNESPMPILFLSSLVGLIGGGFYYVFLAGNNETKELLYYNEFNSSNRVACMRPSKTNFKCRMYKNGELV